MRPKLTINRIPTSLTKRIIREQKDWQRFAAKILSQLPSVADLRKPALFPEVQKLVDEYGWDSDVIRIRVRGLKPKGMRKQFI